MLTLSDNRYQAKLVKRPLLTQVVTTAILFGTGDVIAQQAVDKKGLEKHDLARTGRMVLYGGGESKLPYVLPVEASASQPSLPSHHQGVRRTYLLTKTEQPSSARPRRHGTSSWPRT